MTSLEISNPLGSQAVVGVYTDATMSLEDFHAYVVGVVGRKKVRPSVSLCGPYRHIEYLNPPSGLLVLAHHDTIDGQVDGIHPAAIGKSIANFRNIIEPLKGSGPAYNVHYMTRRSQGALVFEAFGRMIDGGEAGAHSFLSDSHFWLEIYNTSFGPIVGMIKSTDCVHVIRPSTDAVDMKEAA